MVLLKTRHAASLQACCACARWLAVLGTALLWTAVLGTALVWLAVVGTALVWLAVLGTALVWITSMLVEHPVL